MSARTVATVAFWLAVVIAHIAALTLTAPVAARLGAIAGVWLVVAAVYALQLPIKGP